MIRDLCPGWVDQGYIQILCHLCPLPLQPNSFQIWNKRNNKFIEIDTNTGVVCWLRFMQVLCMVLNTILNLFITQMT